MIEPKKGIISSPRRAATMRNMELKENLITINVPEEPVTNGRKTLTHKSTRVDLKKKKAPRKKAFLM